MGDAVRTGSVLAGYRFDSLIGEGAMGAVCLAEDATHELRVAVKAYKPPAAAFRSEPAGCSVCAGGLFGWLLSGAHFQ